MSTKRLSQPGIVWLLVLLFGFTELWAEAISTKPKQPLRIPLFFEELTDQPGTYLARGSNYSLTVSANATQWSPSQSAGRNEPVRLHWLGSNTNTSLSVEEELGGRLHSFLGKDPTGWRRSSAIYKRIRVSNVYPGIDVVYHGTRGALEYDLLVGPGADPRAIRFRFAGARSVRRDQAGNLVIKAGQTEFVQHKPVVYQQYSRERRIIESRYVLRRGEVSFALGEYDHDRPLVIDPVVSYAASFAGASISGEKIVVDADGNAFVMGTVFSQNPVGLDVYGNKFGGGPPRDVFVIKINPAGTDLVFATYFGGNNAEFPASLAIDKEGNAHVVGSTRSNNFPTTEGAFQPNIGNGPLEFGSDAFVTKLSPDGSRLVYSTYLGGGGGDEARGAVVDNAGNLVIVGFADGATFPTTPGTYLTTYDLTPNSDGVIPEPRDGFVAKLDSTGGSLLFSTLVGGGTPAAVDVDAMGNIYAAGSIYGGFQATKDLSPQPATPTGGLFLAKFSGDGRSRLYGTVLGGYFSTVTAIKADADGSVFVAGYTSSKSFVTTPGAFQRNFGGATFSNQYQNVQDGFIAKLNSEGDAYLYSSYLGGNSQDYISNLAVDQSGRAHLVGGTSSTNFPVTSDALQPVYRGGSVATVPGDAFYCVVSATGNRLEYSTYIGSPYPDVISGIDLDLAGSVYLSGNVFYGGPLGPTPGALQMNLASTTIAKLTSSKGTTPLIEELSPNSALVDGSGFQLRVGGSGFASDAVLFWNRTARKTLALSDSQLEATITAEDLFVVGSAEIRIINPQQGVSSARTFDVIPAPGFNPRPSLNSVSPTGVTEGRSDVILTVQGKGFIEPAIVRWNGQDRPTRFLSTTTLEANILAADLSVPHTAKVAVHHSGPGGGLSNEIDFVVAPQKNSSPGPTITNFYFGAAAGSAERQVEITGSNFLPTTVVRWNGVERVAKLQNRRLTLTVPPEDLARAGMSEITLFDRASGKTSNPVPFFTWLQLDVFDLAYDKVGGRLYAFVRDPDRSFRFVLVDPDKGEVLASVPSTNYYGSLAVSDDGRYFYASTQSGIAKTIQRFKILSSAPWLEAADELPVSVLAPMPGKGDAFAAVVTDPFGKVTVSIYDWLTRRPDSFTFSTNESTIELEFVSPSVLHVYSGYGGEFARTVKILTVGSSGIVGVEQAPERLLLGSKPKAVNDVLVGSSGYVYSASSFRQIATLPASGAIPGVEDGLIVMPWDDAGCAVNVFDATTVLPVWVLRGPGGCNSSFRKVVPLGNRRFVLTSGERMLFLRQPSAAPSTMTLKTVPEDLSATVEIGESAQRRVNIYHDANAIPVSLVFQPQGLRTFAGIRLESSISVTPGYARLSVDSSITPVGTFTGNLSFMIGGALAPVITIPVQYTVIPSFPLKAEPASLHFEYQRGGRLPTTQYVRISKEGASFRADYTIWGEGSQSANWMGVNYTDRYTTPINFRVTVNPANLAKGTYRGKISFSMPTSAQRLEVQVTLEIR